MWTVARCALLALNFLLLSSRSYLVATALVTLLNIALVVIWDFAGSGDARPRAAVAGPLAIAIVATLVLFTACHAWLHEILIRPHDSQRADMLVVIQLGIRRLLHGNNPYTIYDVPWPVPLPYGIVMWAPMLIPYLLHADVRFATIAGALFVPAACAMAAVAEARLGRFAIAVAWLATMTAVAFNVPMRDFIAIGHTPTQLAAVGAVRVARRARALVCRGLCLWTVDRGQDDNGLDRTGLPDRGVAQRAPASRRPARRSSPRGGTPVSAVRLRGLARLALCVVRQLPDRDEDLRLDLHHLGAAHDRHDRVAPLARLARRGGRRSDRRPAGVYIASWLAIRRGRRPLPWLALALFAFSMTTLWPVIYLYFDVFLLLVSGALADTSVVRERRLAWVWFGAAAASAVVLLSSAVAMVPNEVSIDIGTGADCPHLVRGFFERRASGRYDLCLDQWHTCRSRSAAPLANRRHYDIVAEPYLPTYDSVQL